MSKFKMGDVVTLKSGGPRMTVQAADAVQGTVKLVYFTRHDPLPQCIGIAEDLVRLEPQAPALPAHSDNEELQQCIDVIREFNPSAAFDIRGDLAKNLRELLERGQ